MNTKFPLLRKIITYAVLCILIAGVAAPTAPPRSLSTQGPWISVLVQATSAQHAAALVEKWGGEVTSFLNIIDGVGALIPVNQVTNLDNEPGFVKITQNAQTMLTEHSFDRGAANIPATDYPDVSGADLAWERGGTGKGVSVAVIDTGIALHPSLMKDPSGKKRNPVIGWVDFVDNKKTPHDPNGHGTHIAGIIADASKGMDDEYNGMAPAARLVGVRVLDRTGTGNYEKVIQGIQWVIQNKHKYNIKVMNLSLHSLVQSPYWADPLNQAVMQAWAEGISVVVAAGNSGPGAMTVSVPGNTPYVITVGAFTDNYTPYDWSDDYLTSFSSAGPTLDGFVKPDLLAPGAHITSTMMPGSYIARNHEASWVNGLYFSMAGTSQAAAVTSGAAAQVLSKNKRLSPDEVKFRLMVTALPWINTDETDVLYSVWQQGAGRLNVYDSVFAEDIEGTANNGLDITADINGTQHFEGYSYYDDAAGIFRLYGYETLPGGYGSWSGGYGSWSGGYGSWSGGYGSWSGGYGSWSGGYGSWSGGYGSWSGGYGSWSGGYGSWSGGFGAWAGQLSDPAFFETFMSGSSPNTDTSSAQVGWVKEQ